MHLPNWIVARVRLRSFSPRRRAGILPLAIHCCLLSAFATTAYGAWVPVTEDSVDLHLAISSLTLDTTHFSGPTLLVGTYRDSSGRSLVLRVDPQTFALLDTIYRSPYVPNGCRAVDLNADTHTDFLISLTSLFGDSARFSAVVALYGPDYQIEDTLSLPRAARDLVVDEVKREIWLGYSHDTTIVIPQGFTDWVSSGLIGFTGAFDYNLAQCRFLGDSLAGQALTLADVNSDGVNDVVALWVMAYSGYCVGCAGPAPDPAWTATGVWMMDGSTESVFFRNWIELGSRWDTYLRNYMILYKQLPVLDLTGDGNAEAVLSWKWQHNNYAGGPDVHDYYAEVFSLATGQRLWKKPLPFGGSGAFTAIPYTLDSSDVPTLLFVGVDLAFPSQWGLRALQGDNGDSLFSTEFRFVSGNNVSLAAPLWDRQRVFDASGSRLSRWRLDLATAVDEIIPNRFVLYPNFPNPFNAGTTISYSLNSPAEVTLTVHDVLGRHVTALVNAQQPKGDYRLTWDGRNAAGQSVPSGVFFLRLSADGEQHIRKMAVLK